MSKKALLSPMLIVTFAFIGLLVFLNLPEEETQGKANFSGSTPVITFRVSETEFPVIVEALGTVKANESVSLTTQQSDVIRGIYFEDGEVVEKGKLLISLNDQEEKARANELEINLQEAKRQLKRITNLAKESVASEQLLDEQQAKVKALSAQLDVANTRISELELRAPFSGKLGIRNVSIGAYVGPNDVITTLDDLQQVKVDFDVSENHLPSVADGQQVSAVSVAYPGEVFVGKINTVDSRVNPITRSIRIRAIIDNPDLKLRPGMLLQINLQKRVLSALVLPEKAIIPNEDQQFVFVIENGKAIQKEVKLGIRRPGKVQVVSGLTSGDIVVTEGALRLRNGSPVTILSESDN